jgi:hypothetical protein
MTTAAHEHHHDEDAPEAVHAMVLFGDKNIYLSHMPLFSPPHNDQVILEVSLTKDGEHPEDTFRDDRKSSGTRFYTVKPPEMHLSVLEPGASFVGDVHRNSYEDDGELVQSGVTVTVKQVVYAQKLDPNTAAPTGGSHYLCFGQPGEFFAAHHITSAPSFDQIVSLTILDDGVAQLLMPQPSLMTVPGSDGTLSRLQPRDAPKAEFVIHPGTRGEHGAHTRITVSDEIFFDDRFLEG